MTKEEFKLEFFMDKAWQRIECGELFDPKSEREFEEAIAAAEQGDSSAFDALLARYARVPAQGASEDVDPEQAMAELEGRTDATAVD